jgi:uncharacterized protein YfaP (DUF2135 family)
VLVDTLRVLVNGQTLEARVAPTGDFSLAVPLKSGDNELQLVTLGELVGKGRVPVPNDRPEPFHLTGNFEQAAILVTLTWDRAGNDLDLYVTDPEGGTSYYGAPITAAGGELDKDDTQGRGPEHFTLTYGDTVRYGAGYRVRVHYYAGEDPVNWTVTVLLDEGKPTQSTKTYTGVVSAPDASNDAPGGSGPDWGDVDVVVPR